MSAENMRVGIVGCGIIGQSWARAFLAAGRPVSIHDPYADIDAVAASLARHADDGQLSVAKDLGQLASCCYVQESIVEDAALKIVLFENLDVVLPPDTVVASSTSALCMSDLVSHLKGRERFLVAHPASPPHALPAVELVPAPFTSLKSTEFSEYLLKSIGQSPVRLEKEVSGFVLNRLQGALLLAMIDVIREGIASPDGVDTLLRDSFGMRWALLGPFEGVHLNAPGGIEDYFNRYSPMFDQFCPDGESLADRLSPTTSAKLQEYAISKVPLEKISARRSWRDGALAEMRAWRDGMAS